MTRLVYLFIVAASCVITGCTNSRHTVNINDYEVAWNEDKVNNWHIAFSKKKGTFCYTIPTKKGAKDTFEIYKGTYGIGLSDHMYLKYSDKPPAGMEPFLVIEASGNYYIQNFTDGRKRIFLRIQKWPNYHL
jgi:hypothetical protein